MKLFIITSVKNLTIIRDTLTKKYPKIVVQGTNSLEEGIDIVTTRHVTENYDIFIIMNQNFIEEDLARGKELSDKLNKACLYAIKDLPIYFLVNQSKKEYQSELKKLLKGENIHMFLYKKLHLTVVEDIIKEVGVITGKKKDDQIEITRKIIEEKKRKLKESEEGYLHRIFSSRIDSGTENFARLSKIQRIITNYSSGVRGTITPVFESSSKVIEEIKGSLFDEPIVPVKDKNKIEDFSITPINREALTEHFKPDTIKRDLEKVDPVYKDHVDYLEELNEIIEKVKNSDREDKHQLVIELIAEKSYATNKLNEILANFITKVANESVEFVTTNYNEELNALHVFGDLNDIDEIVGGKLQEIKKLKEHRNIFKENVGKMIKELQEITFIMNTTLTEVGRQYLESTRNLEKEMLEYANEHNITLNEVMIVKDNTVTKTLKEGYREIATNINNLITSSSNTVTKLMELVGKDEEIINKQEEVIEIMKTHKTKKILTVNNILQTKLQAFYGIDGVGKTHTAVNLAFAYSKYAKVLLFDLNIYNPNLHYYNSVKDNDVENPLWFNKNTITLEEFTRIGISKYMYKELPFNGGLTIVQPSRPISLNEFETRITPSVFGEHVKSFLEQLAQFYDRIFVILPQDLSELEVLAKEIGVLHIINDFEPKNIQHLKKLLERYNSYFENVPIKNVIMNKQTKYINIKPDEYISSIGLNIKDCTFFKLPLFPDSTAYKFNGTIPYTQNVGVKRYFDDYAKKLQ